LYFSVTKPLCTTIEDKNIVVSEKQEC